MIESEKTEVAINSLIRRILLEVKGDPAAIHVVAIDGDWMNALSYRVSHRSGKVVNIPRRHLDDDAFHEIRNGLAMLARE